MKLGRESAVFAFTAVWLGIGCGGSSTLVERPAVPPASVLIRDVAVLDVLTGTVAQHRDVRLEGGKIVSIEATSPQAYAEQIIDGKGSMLLPGLIDVHGHLVSASEPPWEAKLPDEKLNLSRYLYSGVTAVFDPGGHDEESFELRENLRSGKLLGPRLFAAGPIFTAPGGHPIPMLENGLPWFLEDYIISHATRGVGTEAEAREAVRALLVQKPNFVKIALDHIPASAPRLDPKIAAAIADEAKKAGVRTVAHIGTSTDAFDAARAGASAWIHGVYKEKISDADIPKLAAFKMPMAPTLVVFDSYAGMGREPRVPTVLEKQIATAEMLAAYDTRPDDYVVEPELIEMIDQMKAEREHALENVRNLHAAGVVIMAGSDAQSGVFHGPGLHRELMLLSKAGLAPLEVIRAATINTARFLENSQDPSFGQVAVGKSADLILVGENVLRDIQEISNIRGVILGGTPIARKGIN